jgi:hypothetical protein
MNKPSLRDRRRQELRATLDRAVTRRDQAIETLVRNAALIKKLKLSLGRLERAAQAFVPVSISQGELLPPVEPVAVTVEMNDDVTDIPFSELPIADKLDIPAFLRRDQKDAAARAEIEATNAERKKRKTIARIAKMKAKDAGELRKMPLTGKAALAAIRG